MTTITAAERRKAEKLGRAYLDQLGERLQALITALGGTPANVKPHTGSVLVLRATAPMRFKRVAQQNRKLTVKLVTSLKQLGATTKPRLKGRHAKR